MTEGRGEAQDAAQEGTESLPAKRDTQSPATGESHRRPLNSIELPWYGPVCPVVWEGRSREAPPYPDQFPFHSPSLARPAMSAAAGFTAPVIRAAPGVFPGTATAPAAPPPGAGRRPAA